MKNILTIVLVFLVTIPNGFAQRGRPMERIHAAKVAYLTDRLHLTGDQAAAFVPVYNEYEAEIRATRKSYLLKFRDKNLQDADNATARQYVDDNLDYQEKVIDTKRKYNDRFLKVISAQQLAELYVAEREFKQMLKKRLEQRREGGADRFGRGRE